MARFIFLLLLLAAIAFGVHIYLSETKPAVNSPREINRDQLKIIPLSEGSSGKTSSSQTGQAVADAKAEAQAVRKMAEAFSGSACVDFSVKPADAERAQLAFAEMKAGDRVTARNIEEFTRYGVAMPPSKDRKAAETLSASLKKSGLKDISILNDYSLSLGVFSSEEAAKRGLADLESKAGKLLKNAVIVPRTPQPKETIFSLREPDTNMIARLTIMQRDYENSTVKAVPCPSGAAAQAAVATPAKN